MRYECANPYARLRDEDDAVVEYPLDAEASTAAHEWLQAHGFTPRGGDVFGSGTDVILSAAFLPAEREEPPRLALSASRVTRAQAPSAQTAPPSSSPPPQGDPCDTPREGETFADFQTRCGP